MRKILVCQHVPYEILGTLDALFKKSGFRIRYANFGRFPDLTPSIESYQGLVVLGGPMNVDETSKHPHLLHEIKLIEAAFKKDIPVLGICLGAQLLAKTLGGAVTKNPEKEIGWHDVSFTEAAKNDPLFQGFGTPEKLFQWHGDTFQIPKSAIHLAQSSLCENQAFRYKNNVYGLQFHLEVDSPLLNRWLTTPALLEELKDLKTKIHPEHILTQTQEHIDRLQLLSSQAFGEFIKLFGEHRKRGVLPSR